MTYQSIKNFRRRSKKYTFTDLNVPGSQQSSKWNILVLKDAALQPDSVKIFATSDINIPKQVLLVMFWTNQTNHTVKKHMLYATDVQHFPFLKMFANQFNSIKSFS
jgi:hypothetical protein